MNQPPDVTVHIGRKIKRLRELKGVKQETLATKLGITHQAISKMEQSETIDDDKLAQVATALDVTPDAIRNFNEDATVSIIASNHSGNDQSAAVNFQCHFNPLDKFVELYERLLKTEREKNELLQAALDRKQ
jgi:transcriptional regulator with XRE-family HTH domain